MRAKFPVVVHLLFLQDKKILLLRRANTGYEDGNYNVVAGHVEFGESVTQAAIREAFEEIGVTLQIIDLQVVHVMSRKAENERIDFFWVIRHWSGDIENKEPEKCDDLSWVALDALPHNINPYLKYAIEKYQAGIFYSEYGW
jgi:8-oxo-dGTP diphosphatase